MPFRVNEEIVYRCPIKLVNPLSWQYIRAYTFYKNKMLPAGKGWLDESDRYLDAMILISNELNRMDQEKMDNATKRTKHGRS